MPDLDSDIKHVLYDMLLLAQSLRYLINGVSNDTPNQARFGVKEVAKVAAATKVRSLLHFLYDAIPGPKDKLRQDDILIAHFAAAGKCKPPIPNQALNSRTKTYDKYVAHLTAARTAKVIKRPKANDILKDGRAVLKRCKARIDECFANGISKKGQTKKYYKAFIQEWDRVKRSK